MLSLINIYKKLLVWLNYLKSDQPKKKDLFTGSILFGLKDDNIFISADIPKISTGDINDITDLAENYANFIVHITSGLVYDEIMNILHSKLKDDKLSLEEKLLVENIAYFIPIIENEIETSATKAYLNTQPIVRPINVFGSVIK